ncbi:hypothetical protein SLE2022_039480 [Rubroshorea leprosula]
MASLNSFILAFFMALAFSSVNVGLAARRLQQLPPLPTIPKLPQPTIPNLPQPTVPTLPQPTVPTLPTPQPTLPQPGALPPLPSIPTTLPSFPKVTLPPLPSIGSIANIPLPFFSPPPATTSP